MKIIVILVSLLMIGGSIAVIFSRSLKKAAIIMGIVSLIAALLFVLMQAYDVAITEASIGAVLTTAVYFFALRRLEENGYGDKDADKK